MAVKVGPCHVCGLVTKLSYENVPPKAAFNDSSVLRASLHDLILEENQIEGRTRRSTQRRGAGGYTLCERCNNDTGAWYVNQYVLWAHQAMRYRLAGPSSLALPYFVFPGRVAKQIMCMFASACGPHLFAENPELAKYVLDKDARGIPNKFRLYAYMVSTESTQSRQTGILAQLSGQQVHAYAEISFQPLGYMLTVDSDPPVHGLFDMTFFTHHSWMDYREMHLTIPTREVHGHFPADFRNKDEWDAVKRRPRQTTDPQDDPST